MAGFTDGVADAMQDLQSQKAVSDAGNANRRAIAAEGRAARDVQSAEGRADTMLQGALMWKQEAARLLRECNLQTSKLSGCVILINAMIKTMEENMTPSEREKFRDNLVQRARARMIEVDNKLRGTDNDLKIEENFKLMEQNKILGIV